MNDNTESEKEGYELCFKINMDEDIYVNCDKQDTDEYIAKCYHIYNIFWYLAFDRKLYDYAIGFTRFHFPKQLEKYLKSNNAEQACLRALDST